MPNSQAGLTPAMFHVLLALADGDKHGYAILKEVGEHSGGEVHLSTGTLYGVIKRLLEEGLIVELTGRHAPEHDDQRRRYYRLTGDGRAVAVEETRRLEKLLARARSKRLVQVLRGA
jgi:DNA-binding PadR family transcriptional regulator